MSASLAWYVASTIAGREHGLASALLRLSIPTYLPTFQATRRRSRLVYDPRRADYVTFEQEYLETAPLWPGYLLAQMDDYGWSRVKTDAGVHVAGRGLRWVDFGAGPAVMSDAEVRGLMKAIRANEKQVKAAGFVAGQPVVVTGGPFSGMTGLFSHEAKDRIFVLFEMLGGQRAVACAAQDVAGVV